MQMNRLAAVVTALAGFLCQAHAKTISLNFDSLPSAQGWTYDNPQNNASEASVFSVNGGVLTQNTLNAGFGHFAYELLDAIDPTLPFAISMRARVLEDKGHDERVQRGFDPLGGFGVYAFTGTEAFSIVLSPAMTQDIHHAPSNIDNTQFHDYRLEVTPGVGYKTFVDNVLLNSGTPLSLIDRNGIFIGDGTFYVSTHAEVTSYVFTQVPEPTTVLLHGSGLAGLALWRRRANAACQVRRARVA